MVGEQLNAMVAAHVPEGHHHHVQRPARRAARVSQMWSGDIINAQSYLPEGTSTDILQYWFPPDGKGLVDNDLMVVLRSGKNPVLAHLFINHMLDPEVAMQNFSAIGYQPPQNSDHGGSACGRGVHTREPSHAPSSAGVLRRRLSPARTRRGQPGRLAQGRGRRSTPAGRNFRWPSR